MTPVERPDPIEFDALLDDSPQNLTMGGGGMRVRLNVKPECQANAVGLAVIKAGLLTVSLDQRGLPKAIEFRAHLAPCVSALGGRKVFRVWVDALEADLKEAMKLYALPPNAPLAVSVWAGNQTDKPVPEKKEKKAKEERILESKVNGEAWSQLLFHGGDFARTAGVWEQLPQGKDDHQAMRELFGVAHLREVGLERALEQFPQDTPQGLLKGAWRAATAKIRTTVEGAK